MKLIQYTEEMMKQDKLWKNEEEDTAIMEDLFCDIYNQARELGYKKFIYIYQGTSEAVAEIYDSKEDMMNEQDHVLSFGYCKPLIEHINKTLKEQRKLEDIVQYVKSNEDLFNDSGITMSQFLEEIEGYIENIYFYPDSGLTAHILAVYDNLSDALSFLISDWKWTINKTEDIYEKIVGNNLYLHKIRDRNNKIVIVQF